MPIPDWIVRLVEAAFNPCFCVFFLCAVFLMVFGEDLIKAWERRKQRQAEWEEWKKKHAASPRSIHDDIVERGREREREEWWEEFWKWFRLVSWLWLGPLWSMLWQWFRKKS